MKGKIEITVDDPMAIDVKPSGELEDPFKAMLLLQTTLQIIQQKIMQANMPRIFPPTAGRPPGRMN